MLPIANSITLSRRYAEFAQFGSMLKFSSCKLQFRSLVVKKSGRKLNRLLIGFGLVCTHLENHALLYVSTNLAKMLVAQPGRDKTHGSHIGPLFGIEAKKGLRSNDFGFTLV